MIGALSVMLVWASSASASFHLMKISEVYPGTAVDPDSGFIELQMFSGGQNLVMGHHVQLWDSTGFRVYDVGLPGNVGNPANQATILLGDTTAAGSPDFTDMTLNIQAQAAGAGAVCFPDADPKECVAWGPVPGGGFVPPLPAAVGTHAAPAGIPNGQSLTRSKAAGCATLLEASDDTDNSLADFALTAPSPRNNSVTPTESACLAPPVIPGNPTSPINPAGHVRKRKCKKKQKSAAAAKRRCKKKK